MRRSVGLMGLLAVFVATVVASSWMASASAANAQCGWDSAIGNPGTGSQGPAVRAMTEFDVDGDGVPELIVGGTFSSMNGLDGTNFVAAWNPAAQWSAIGNGTPGAVEALAVYQNELYAAGSFQWPLKCDPACNPPTRLCCGFNPGDKSILAKWDPIAGRWEQVGGESLSRGRSLAVYQGTLYVGGLITFIEGLPFHTDEMIYTWDGGGWGSVSGGVTPPGGVAPDSPGVYSMAVFDADGDGVEELYVGGIFARAGDVADTAGIALWDGASWSSVGGGLIPNTCQPNQPGCKDPHTLALYVLHVHDDGSGAKLYAGGPHNFRLVSLGLRQPVNGIAVWNGTSWAKIISHGFVGVDPGRSSVRALTTHDDGSGPALYVGGTGLDEAGGIPISNLARWNGADWSSVGGGADGGVRALRSFASSLLVGGFFGTVFNQLGAVDPTTSFGIARWFCPVCRADLDGNGSVGITDFLTLLAAWGPCAGCPADLDGDGSVGITDLLALLAAWGACP